jgi:predicted nucleic acid-binding protein
LRRFLLDSSVWLAAHDADDRYHAACRRIVLAPSIGHATLDLTLYEVANVATTKWHDAALARRLVEAIEIASAGHIIHNDSNLMAAAITLAEAHQLTVYDAAYPAAVTTMADGESLTLVSIDSDLTRAQLATHAEDINLPAGA